MVSKQVIVKAASKATKMAVTIAGRNKTVTSAIKAIVQSLKILLILGI